MAKNLFSLPSHFLMALKEMDQSTKGCGFPKAPGALSLLKRANAWVVAVAVSIIVPVLHLWEAQSTPSSGTDSFCGHG